MVEQNNTIFITCTKSNNDLRFFESNSSALALGIDCINIHEKTLEELEEVISKFDNVIYYPHELICYGGVVSTIERETFECFMLILKLHKNLIIYNDTIYPLKRWDIKNVATKLGQKIEKGSYGMMSQSEFSSVNSRMFQPIMKAKEFPFMHLLYACNNYKTREEELKKFIFAGENTFFVQGAVGKSVPKDSLINVITTKKITYPKFLQLLNDSYCTILIKDPRWTKIGCTLPSWRFVEAWTTNCICFITETMREFCPDMKDDFFYVKDYDELKTKVNLIVANKDLRFEKLNHQIKLLNEFDKMAYRNSYYNYLNNLHKIEEL